MSYLGNREPPLGEILDDPIVRLVMARDRLLPDDVKAFVEAAVRRLRREKRPAYLLVRSD
jgi:hypothetical protein